SPGCTQSSNSLSSVAPPFAFGQQATDTALNVILIVVLLINVVSLGRTMEIAKITTRLRRPKGVAIAIMAQYSIMPLTAFILGKLFQLGTSESLTILICGCCPGGNLSNIFSLALRGDMNLSSMQQYIEHIYIYIYAVSIHAVLCKLIMLPEEAASGRNVELAEHHSPTNPSDKTRSSTKIQSITFSLSCEFLKWMVMLLLSSAAMIVLSVANMGSCIMVIFSPSLLGSSALMPLTGFLLGCAVSAAFKLDDRCRRIVFMESGCQNVQLCSAILKVTFAPEIIGPLYFFPLLYLLFQLGEGPLLTLVFRIHDRIKKANGK
ncbi:NTCP protein, partial [Pachycephala philippinensis]|nr:NTCP protein [Pachycephala philippinensis]